MRMGIFKCSAVFEHANALREAIEMVVPACKIRANEVLRPWREEVLGFILVNLIVVETR